MAERTKMVVVRVSPQAHASYLAGSKKLGLPLSGWVRKVLAEWCRVNGVVSK